jgi:hypothetical protein
MRHRLAPLLPWLAVGVVLAGAAHQAAVALGWLSIGLRTGEPASGQSLFLGSALIVLLLAALALPFAAVGGRRVAALPWLALAAALLVVAHFFTYDPYYAPSLRRMSDGGAIPGTWIVLVVACALAASLVAARADRLGSGAVALACLLAFGTALLADFGH